MNAFVSSTFAARSIMASHFQKHHSAAKKAFDSGNHSQAMHHIGHMMMAVRSAQRGASPPSSKALTGGSPVGVDFGAPTAGVDTGPVTSSGDSMAQDFGGVQRSPATATPAPTGQPAAVKPNGFNKGFNKGRFAAMRGRGGVVGGKA